MKNFLICKRSLLIYWRWSFRGCVDRYDYNTTGLEATVANGTPILCAACHSSNALPGTGVTGVKPFTTAIHAYHSHVVDPNTNLALNSSQN